MTPGGGIRTLLLDILTDRPPLTHHVPAILLWRKDVPLKASMFTWRLFRHRLPSKTNLFHRGIIHENAQVCVSGCGFKESDHLFLYCPLFGQIW